MEQQGVDNETFLTFRVIDSGIGISLEQKEQIFNIFVQGDDSSTRRFDGLGLGLAKSRGYCRLLGGDITLVSEQGKGSEFIISVPVKVLGEGGKIELGEHARGGLKRVAHYDLPRDRHRARHQECQ